MEDIRNDLFILPTLNDQSIIYSPLRGAAFYANPSAVVATQQFIESGTLPDEDIDSTLHQHLTYLAQRNVEEPLIHDFTEDVSSVLFILSQICNFGCHYCYANNSHASEVLSFNAICTVIDTVCAQTTGHHARFGFIGGGEPLATWDVFERAVRYIHEVSATKSLSARIGLTTNGSLLTKDRVAFLKEYGVVVSVSFDILPGVQNQQRPYASGAGSFEVVDRNIKLLLANGIVPRFRSTITKRNANLMPDMVRFVVDRYPEIKILHFEPVTDKADNDDSFFSAYNESFWIARTLAKQHGILCKNSIINSMRRVSKQFCGGEVCITPSTDIVACHRISSKREPLFEAFRYGNVKAGRIHFDELSVTTVQETFRGVRNECSTCFAKWHCAGGCPMFRNSVSDSGFAAYCDFVRQTTTMYLVEKLG